MQYSISTKEAAERLGVSAETVKRLIRIGQLRAEKLHGSWVIDEASLLALKQNRLDGRTLPAGQISRKMAAKKLCVSVEVIRRMIRTGELQASKDDSWSLTRRASMIA